MITWNKRKSYSYPSGSSLLSFAASCFSCSLTKSSRLAFISSSVTRPNNDNNKSSCQACKVRSFSNCITSHKGASSLAHFNLVKKICPDSLSNLSSELFPWDGHLRELSVSHNCLLNEWWLYLNSKGPFLYLWGCW